jgi:hypothetical protein
MYNLVSVLQIVMAQENILLSILPAMKVEDQGKRAVPRTPHFSPLDGTVCTLLRARQETRGAKFPFASPEI